MQGFYFLQALCPIIPFPFGFALLTVGHDRKERTRWILWSGDAYDSMHKITGSEIELPTDIIARGVLLFFVKPVFQHRTKKRPAEHVNLGHGT